MMRNIWLLPKIVHPPQTTREVWHYLLNPTVPGVVTGCLVKETLKAGSSLRGEGYILLRMKKPAPQQNNTPIIRSTLSEKHRTSQTIFSPTQHH